MTSAPLLRLRDLGVRYPGQAAARAALQGLTLDLQVGERLLLLGPNGAGKSTCIRVCAGQLRPSAGRAEVAGWPPRSARHLVGVVTHVTFLYDELTALENLRLFGDLYGVDRPTMRAREMLENVGLLHLAEEQVGRLSRGQQQRVTIARALLHDPPLLLLDEPDTGLDVAAFSLLERLVLDRPRAVVLTTHNLAAGLRLGTRAVVLAGGRPVAVHPRVGPEDYDDLAGAMQALAQSRATR